MAPNPRWTRSEDAIRGVLLCGSLVFALSAVALLGAPTTFAELLGLETSTSVEWSLRMVGACLVALCGQMFLVRSAPNRQVRGAAAVMIVGGGLMTMLTVFLPGESWTLARWGYLAFGTTFMLLYIFLLWLGATRKVTIIERVVQDEPGEGEGDT